MFNQPSTRTKKMSSRYTFLTRRTLLLQPSNLTIQITLIIWRQEVEIHVPLHLPPISNSIITQQLFVLIYVCPPMKSITRQFCFYPSKSIWVPCFLLGGRRNSHTLSTNPQKRSSSKSLLNSIISNLSLISTTISTHASH